MKMTQKLMLTLGLFLQVSSFISASDDNRWSNAIEAFGGVDKIKPKSMPLENARKISIKAGDTPEAQAIGLYVSDKMTKSRFPKASGNVVAALQNYAQQHEVANISMMRMDFNNNNNNN